jgi:acyl-[acyl-carrier-protein]-phospholipid O-acyltransferase/long-chain-fatty-acid--[acyl-carrier-protein] ligase
MAESRGKAGSYLGFWALIATQFQGAFNDNAFKFIIIFYLPRLFLDPEVGASHPTMLRLITPLSAALFTIPFIIFNAYAGALADRYSKKAVVVWTKYAEVAIMVCGLVAFWLGSPVLIWSVLFLMAAQSTFFSPAKYGLLPEILPESRLSWGNGILQMGTLVAIIIGTAVAGPLLDAFSDRIYLASVVLILLSGIGVVTSYGITRPPAANPRQRIPCLPWSGMGQYFKLFWADRWLLLTMLGIAYFWFAGALLQLNLVEHAKVTLDLPSDTLKSYLQVSLALGIGIGSVAAGYLSGAKIEVGLIPLGALGLTTFGALLAWPGYSFGAILALLFGLGFFAGFFQVPMAATLQERSPDAVKGGMIATTNFVTFTGMTIAAGLFWLMFSWLSSAPIRSFCSRPSLRWS